MALSAGGQWPAGAWLTWLGGLALAALLASPSARAADRLPALIAEQLQPEARLAADAEDQADLKLLAPFYQERGFQPVWLSDGRLRPQGAALIAVLAAAGYDGLNAADYQLGRIKALQSSTAPVALAELDLRLSLGIMAFASDLGSGRLEPSAVDGELFLYPHDIDRGEVIRAAALASDIGIFVGRYRPKQVDYWQLKDALAQYRTIEATGGWPAIPGGPTLELGMSDPRVKLLRQRLRRTDDLPFAQDLTLREVERVRVDADLVAAIRRFQQRHGLEPDGKVGPKTLAALNLPVEARIEQLMLNLERRRWLPDRRDQRYILVNLADFHLEMFDQNQKVFETPVVIGAPYSRTPVFTADMTYLVMNPYWNVPPRIAADELLPKTKANPSYLQTHGFDLLSDWGQDPTMLDPAAIDWSRVTSKSFRYKLRQRPGPANALGRLKFMMQNPFDVYLHDTPAREQFALTERSFSHGCIRVAEPEALADMLLRTEPGWSRARIAATVASGASTTVTLSAPVPVQINYQTAWVGADRQVQFRNDIYGRDDLLADALRTRIITASSK